MCEPHPSSARYSCRGLGRSKSVTALVLALALAQCVWVGSARADVDVYCSVEGMVTTGTTERSDVASLLCEGAAYAKARLAACGIRSALPIRFVVGRRTLHGAGLKSLATVAMDEETIWITGFDDVAWLAARDPVYARLERSALYRSLAVHEVVHVLMRQHLGEHDLPRGAHEMLAYAMQLASLPRHGRRHWERLGAGGSGGLFMLSELLLAFEPRVFAVLADRQVRRLGLCPVIERARSGTLVLPITED